MNYAVAHNLVVENFELGCSRERAIYEEVR